MPLPARPAKAAAEKAAAPSAACPRGPAARKVTVLALHKARGGKVYQVLAPTTAPRHLSDDDLDRMLDAMVAAR